VLGSDVEPSARASLYNFILDRAELERSPPTSTGFGFARNPQLTERTRLGQFPIGMTKLTPIVSAEVGP